MYKISICDFTKTREHNLKKMMAEISETNSESVIHDIRIEIKKIYAINSLYKFNRKKLIRKKTLHLMQEIFQIAGKIRKYQIELKILKQHYPKKYIVPFYNLIKKEKKLLEHEFYKKFYCYPFRLKISLNSSNLSLDEISSFLISCYKNVEKLKFNNTKIHNIRKKLKNAFYVIDFINSSFYNQIGIHQKKLIKRIGNWHDLVVIRKNIIKNIKIENYNHLINNNLKMIIENLNERILSAEKKIKAV